MYRLARAQSRKPIRQFLRTLMLALGVLGMPSAGQVALNGAHCAPHEAASAQAGGMHQMAGMSGAWQDASSHSCSHCPESECARIAPCTSSGASLLATPVQGLVLLSAGRSDVSAVTARVRSVLSPPGTPPPVLIA